MLVSLATSVRAALESVKMLHLCRINRRFEMLLVSAEPEVSQGSCFIWAGSLCAALSSPCSLTGVDLVGGERWCLSMTLPGEGQGER